MFFTISQSGLKWFMGWCLNTLVISLALAGVGLILTIPPDSLNTALVYKGF